MSRLRDQVERRLREIPVLVMDRKRHVPAAVGRAHLDRPPRPEQTAQDRREPAGRDLRRPDVDRAPGLAAQAVAPRFDHSRQRRDGGRTSVVSAPAKLIRAANCFCYRGRAQMLGLSGAINTQTSRPAVAWTPKQASKSLALPPFGHG